MGWEGFLYGLTLRGTEAPVTVAVHPTVVQRTEVAENWGLSLPFPPSPSSEQVRVDLGEIHRGPRGTGEPQLANQPHPISLSGPVSCPAPHGFR